MMDKEDWFFASVMAVVGIGLLVLAACAVGAIRQQELDGRSSRACISHGMQWIDGNCVKIGN